MTREQMIDAYLTGVGELRKAVAGMSREQLLARPVAGKWSTLEVVCHLADFDPILADRMKRVLAFERPTLLSADENQFVATLAYHERNVDEELAVIENTRRQMARILRHAAPEAFERVGVHSERGPKTLTEILTSASNHFSHHIPFIYEKRKALGLST